MENGGGREEEEAGRRRRNPSERHAKWLLLELRIGEEDQMGRLRERVGWAGLRAPVAWESGFALPMRAWFGFLVPHRRGNKMVTRLNRPAAQHRRAQWRYTTTTRRLVCWSPRAWYVHLANQQSLIIQKISTCGLPWSYQRVTYALGNPRVCIFRCEHLVGGLYQLIQFYKRNL